MQVPRSPACLAEFTFPPAFFPSTGSSSWVCAKGDFKACVGANARDAVQDGAACATFTMSCAEDAALAAMSKVVTGSLATLPFPTCFRVASLGASPVQFVQFSLCGFQQGGCEQESRRQGFPLMCFCGLEARASLTVRRLEGDGRSSCTQSRSNVVC